MKNNLVASVDSMAAELERFQLCWDQFKPREETLTTNETLQSGLAMIRAKRAEWDQLVEAVNKLRCFLTCYVTQFWIEIQAKAKF